jgi:hypothetical protein
MTKKIGHARAGESIPTKSPVPFFWMDIRLRKDDIYRHFV